MLSTSYLLGLVWLVEVALVGWALLDALRHASAAYPAAGKLTKPKWLALLGFALLLILLACPISAVLEQAALSPVNVLPLAGLVAGCVYLADVRPAVQQFRGGRGGRQGPYGPW